MARRTDDAPTQPLVQLATIALNVGCENHLVEAKVRDDEVRPDWEGTDAVTWSKAREVRLELIAEQRARMLSAAAGNAEVDRQKRQAQRERAEAARRERDSQYLGVRVSAPGKAPEPWADLPSEGDDE
jgi:hypothetical protein